MVQKPGGARDVREFAIAIVAEEMALPHTAYKNVREAIVVVITDSHSHSVHFDVQAGGASNIRERSVAIVVVQTQSRFLALVAWPIHAIHQQDVLPAVVVVIEKCAARAQCFGQKFSSEGSAIMLKLNSCRGGDIDEAEPQGRGWSGKKPAEGPGKKIVRREGCVKRKTASCGNKPATLHGRPHIMEAHTSWKPTHHGRLTSPLRMAYTTNSAVLCMPNASMILARCTATVLELRPKSTAFSLLDFPATMC